MQIYKFNSILKPVLWGGDKLMAFKRLPACDEPIGESWELSAVPGRESVVTEGDERGMSLNQLVQHYGADLVGDEVYRRYGHQFPLLIKFIDAKRDLSIQVHPDDALAQRRHGCSGKNEMWYVLHADDEAAIHLGFSRSITAEEFDRHLADGTILEAVNIIPSQPGDIFFIPAGQIHAIGAGNLLVEIQQSSDITYRVWDYNRPDADGNLRPLHINEAREALDFNARDGRVSVTPSDNSDLTSLMTCDAFEVCRLDIKDNFTLEMPLPHSFVALVCISGETTITVEGMPSVKLRQGETALLPAIVDKAELNGTACLLTASVPNLEGNITT